MNFIRMILWKEFLHIKADKLMVRLITVPVLIQLFVIGYALTVEVKNIPIAACDRSNTPQSRELLSRIQRFDRFIFKGVFPETAAKELLYRGEAKMVVIIPADFSKEILDKEGSAVQLIADGQDANSSKVALGYCSMIIGNWARHKLEFRLTQMGMDIKTLIPVEINIDILFNSMLKSTWFMIPALAELLITIVTALLTGFSIVKERENGTFEQLMVTPVKSIHVIIGKAVPFIIIGLIEMSVVMLVATFWFKIPFRGSLVTLFVFALTYMISSLSIGIFTSTVTRSSQQVLFLTWFILIFFILLSGFFIPVENMPRWVQILTYINPVRFFMVAVRDIFLKGSGFMLLLNELRTLLIIGISVFGMAFISFRRRVG